MWAGACHLVFGNFAIGVVEGLLISRLYKVRPGRALFWMIPANYFSMVAGLFLFGSSYAMRFGEWYLGDVPLYRVGGLLIIATMVSYVASILLEWVFVAAAMWKVRHGVGRTLLASVVAQTASYLILGALYYGITSLSLISVPTMTAGVLNKNPGAYAYFIGSQDRCIYRMQLDGSERQQVGPAVDDTVWRQLELLPSEDGKSLDLCLTARDKTPQLVVPAVTPAYAGAFDSQAGPKYYSGGPAVDLRAAGDRIWEVRTGFWAMEGLSAHNDTTNEWIHLALETPFLNWQSKFATILPGEQVVYEVGEQVVLLDLPTRRMKFLARGSNPVVILAKTAATSIEEPK
jgi:hypothetical protein